MSQIIGKLKAAHRSLQVWFNSLIAALGLSLPYFIESIPSLQAYLPEDIYKFTMATLVIGNILIHFRPTKRADDAAPNP